MAKLLFLRARDDLDSKAKYHQIEMIIEDRKTGDLRPIMIMMGLKELYEAQSYGVSVIDKKGESICDSNGNQKYKLS
ncbi:MAG: hypothetical protein WC755_01530 [Candidatus Woesearchaeota archaeon]|jgi:hypothetical protein